MRNLKPAAVAFIAGISLGLSALALDFAGHLLHAPDQATIYKTANVLAGYDPTKPISR